MLYFFALALAVGLGVPIAVQCAALAMGRTAAAAFEGIARQPEAGKTLQLQMLIAFGFIESLVIYSLLVFFMLKGSLPSTEVIIEIMKSTAATATAAAATVPVVR